MRDDTRLGILKGFEFEKIVVALRLVKRCTAVQHQSFAARPHNLGKLAPQRGIVGDVELLHGHQVGQILGMDRWQTESFLAEHEAQRPYTLADWNLDRKSLDGLIVK